MASKYSVVVEKKKNSKTTMSIKIFIDAQIYLDFYRLKEVNPLLQSLVQLADHILVTRQVANEVYRNKAQEASGILTDDTTQFGFKIKLPDTLIANALVIEPTIEENFANLRKMAGEMNLTIDQFRSSLTAIYSQTLEDVSKGKDKVSLELEKIFQNAIEHNEPQFNKAKRRKDLGNPPGKPKDPIGDELNWEQILDYSQREKCSIWVVSRDKDFYSKSKNSQIFGNALLLKEISDKGLPDFIFFNDLSSTLTKFKTDIMPDLVIPTPTELKKASEAQAEKNTQEFDVCQDNHTIAVRSDGRFDIYYCTVCKKSLGGRISDCDEGF